MQIKPRPSWKLFVICIILSNLLVLQFARRSNFLYQLPESPLHGQSQHATSTTLALPNLGDVSFQLAYNQSFGFFNDISDHDWKEYYQRRAREAQHYRFPDHPNQGCENPSEWNFHNWDPYFTCPHLQKMGGLGGAAKWTCDVERLRKRTNCLVYSIGSRGNFKFELDIYNKLGNHCEIHIFDPDPCEQKELFDKNMYYHQWGLKSSYSPRYKENSRKTFYDFYEIRSRLGHANRTIDIFKIDCEGCEWHTFKDWVDQDLRQILIETHSLPVAAYERQTDFGIYPSINASDFFDALKSNGYVLFSKEVNSQKGLGRSVEWSFLKLHPSFFE